MTQLRSYFLSIVAVALIVSIVKRLMGEKGSTASIAKLTTGLALTFAVISPLVNLDFTGMNQPWDSYAFDAEQTVAQGTQISSDALAQSIKQQTESYILDKATTLGADLTVEVKLSNDTIPIPKSVIIIGQISPYAKNNLQNMIKNDLGIDKEHQTWK